MGKFNITSILISFILAQVVSVLLSILLVVLHIAIYKQQAFTAFLENSASIYITLITVLVVSGTGGYFSALFNKQHVLNSALLGIIFLVQNVFTLYLLDFIYASNHKIALILTGLTIIPATIFGYYLKNQPIQAT